MKKLLLITGDIATDFCYQNNEEVLAKIDIFMTI